MLAFAAQIAQESRWIFGLDPAAAVLIAAAILIAVVLAIVAMTMGPGEPQDEDDWRRP